VLGVSLTRATGDGLSGDSADAAKSWVDARITISPLTASNEIGQNHVITATVKTNDGSGSGYVLTGGVTVNFSLTNSNGATAAFVGASSCVTSSAADATLGTCTVTIKSPTLPRTARLIAELSPQLDDFFPRLPVTGAVAPGAVWTDTVTRSENDPDGHKVSVRRISHYAAGGDTTIDGRRGMLITQRTEVHITTSAPMQQQPFVAVLTLAGDEQGTALFSVADGRMLSRERDGELRGEVTYKGGDKPWVVNQSYHFHRTDILESPPPQP